MQNKLPIFCYPETPLRVTKCIDKSKFSHFQILLFSILHSLFSIPANAQQTQAYEWDWAISGGSSIGGTDKETIHDIKVGTDGNYYFIATIYGSGQIFNAQLDGQPVYPNNLPNNLGGGAKDIFLFSTDCEGEVLWSRAIGGGSDDIAYNLVLDSNDNVYIGGYFNPAVSNSAGTYPVRFSPTDSLPTNSNDPDYYKRIYLVKYDKDGNYQGKKALQGNVNNQPNGSHYGSQILNLAISNDTLHFIVGLLSGTHLDNQVTVPSQYAYYPNTWTYNFQYHLAKYDTNLNYVNSMVLPIILDNGSGIPAPVQFAYDETNNTYYMTGERGSAILMAYNGDYIVNNSYIIAINGNNGSKKWIREFYTDNGGGPLSLNRFTSLTVDDISNVYVGGQIFRKYNDNTVKIYDPTGTYTYPVVFTSASLYSNLPFVTKFDSNGTVEWVKLPTDFAPDPNAQDNPAQPPKGLAINNNEVAFGLCEAVFEWEGHYLNLSHPYRGDPTILRLNKNTGAVIGLNTIKGDSNEYEYITAISVDNDGNYIAGGSFISNLFMNNNLGITPLISTGESDFFVAKLANSLCGSGNVSTNKFNKLTVNVYPNPTTDIVTIETDENLFNYSVYDINGREIQTGIFGNTNQINLQSASNGVYFVKVSTTQGSSATVKVVKQ